VLSDPDAALKTVRLIRNLAPHVPVFVRARYRDEAERLRAEGAVAIAEELEASLEVLAQVLTRLDVPGNLIEVSIVGYRRRDGLKTLRPGVPSVALETLAPEILAAPVASHQVQSNDGADRRTLASLRLRSETGASVLAVKRNGRYLTSSLPDLELRSDDVLYLIGDETSVRRARERLGRPTPTDQQRS